MKGCLRGFPAGRRAPETRACDHGAASDVLRWGRRDRARGGTRAAVARESGHRRAGGVAPCGVCIRCGARTGASARSVPACSRSPRHRPRSTERNSGPRGSRNHRNSSNAERRVACTPRPPAAGRAAAARTLVRAAGWLPARAGGLGTRRGRFWKVRPGQHLPRATQAPLPLVPSGGTRQRPGRVLPRHAAGAGAAHAAGSKSATAHRRTSGRARLVRP